MGAMRPAILRVIGFTVAGAMISLGVAWTCSLAGEPIARGVRAEASALYPINDPRLVTKGMKYEYWKLIRWDSSVATFLHSWRMTRATPREDSPIVSGPAVLAPILLAGTVRAPHAWAENVDGHHYDYRYIVAWGWPARSCWYEVRNTSPRDSRAPTVVEGGFTLSIRGIREERLTVFCARALPIRPLWPGLLANTAFYGLILWALWFTAGAVRRGLRRRRGACLRCGYDLRGAEAGTACPECGGGRQAVRTAAPTTTTPL
jgi:hypothetical protein